MPNFIPGIKLNEMFYEEIVGPLMEKYFPNLPYSAALVGVGSDVLGYDSEISTDHNWGPRMQLFFRKQDFDRWVPYVDKMLRKNLPYTFKGFSTNFTPENPQHYLKQQPKYIKRGEVNHLIQFYTIQSFLQHYLYFDRDKNIRLKDWLTFPEQSLLDITSGRVYFDGLKEFNKMRAKFAYYPKDIWLYAIKAQWGKIGDELSHQARSGQEGDEIGSRISATKMVERIIRMAFLLERKYAPYHKWLGKAFANLNASEILAPRIRKILDTTDWKKRQLLIAKTHQVLGKMQNDLNITRKVSTKLIKFPGRKFPVMEVKHFMIALDEEIQDPGLKKLKYLLGKIDQFIDHTRLSQDNYVYRVIRAAIK